MINKIISGGQTGADRAGLDAAIESGVEHGGWAPRGRKAEDGTIPDKYDLTELTMGGYPKRTEQNVVDSDGTVIFSFGKLTGGSLLTRRLARKHNRPCLHIDLDTDDNPGHLLRDWLIDWNIKILNVAGQRASQALGIYERVKRIVKTVLDDHPG
jgi:hypothetical protein